MRQGRVFSLGLYGVVILREFDNLSGFRERRNLNNIHYTFDTILMADFRKKAEIIILTVYSR